MNSKPASNQKRPASTSKAPTASTAKKTATTINQPSESWIAFAFKPLNLLFGLMAILFLVWGNTTMPSYHWVHKDLLKGGYELCDMVQKEINKRTQSVHDPILKRQIAYDTKMEAKIGVEFLVLKQIRDNTPPDAVILFPPSNVITQKTSYLTLKFELAMKTYTSYFLYPRTVVYETEKGKNPFFEKAQYVFVLHGWGFEYLDYVPKVKNAVDILPLHQLQNH
jgi:hypothetical protein